MKIVDVDRGWRKLRKAYEQYKEAHVRYGFLQGSASKENIDKAIKHEFGTKKVPSRPFMRQGFDTYWEEWARELKDIISDLSVGVDNVEHRLDRLGNLAIADTKENLDKGEFVPLAPYTISEKGNDRILRQTHSMVLDMDREVQVTEGEKIDLTKGLRRSTGGRSGGGGGSSAAASLMSAARNFKALTGPSLYGGQGIRKNPSPRRSIPGVASRGTRRRGSQF